MPSTETGVFEEHLRRERNRQVAKLIELDFHKALGMSQIEYRRSIPAFTRLEPELTQQSLIPLIIEPRITIPEQCHRTGTRLNIGNEGLTDTTRSPAIPYTIWAQVHRAGVFIHTRPDGHIEAVAAPAYGRLRDGYEQLHQDKPGGPSVVNATLREALALSFYQREQIQDKSIFALGSSWGRFVPYVHNLRRLGVEIDAENMDRFRYHQFPQLLSSRKRQGANILIRNKLP